MTTPIESPCRSTSFRRSIGGSSIDLLPQWRRSTVASLYPSSHDDFQNKKQSQTTMSTPTKAPPTAVDFEPPLACVRRILKHTLPSSTNVGKDASSAFARASGIFIIYLTACANDFAREHKRQTITANDVLEAIKVRACSSSSLGSSPSNTLSFVVVAWWLQSRILPLTLLPGTRL